MDVLKRNNVRVSGPAPAAGTGTRQIVFAHGFGCDQTAWTGVARLFQDDCQVVLFDHVGAGGSDVAAYDPTRYGSLDGYATDLLEVMDALDLHGATFVGHSVAAMIGTLAAIRRPDRFAAMVMLCPSPRYIDTLDYAGGFSRDDVDGLLEVLDRNFLTWSRATAPAIMGNPDRPELADTLGDTFCRTDPEIARHFARVTFMSDHRADLAQLPTRSLILQTAHDMIAPVSVGQYVASNVQDGRFVLMQATGHCPHMSAPGETADLIRRFLPT